MCCRLALDVGVTSGTPRQLADMLLAYHHDHRVKRVCRTAVISVQTPKKATNAELADLDRRLLRAAADLQKFLKELQGLQWTVQFLTGRGKGRRKSVPVYTKAQKLDVRILAFALFDSIGKLRKDRWDKLVEAGKIGNFRRRNNGAIISFEFQGRRLRLATLKNFLVAFADEGNNQSGDNMTAYRRLAGLGRRLRQAKVGRASRLPIAERT